MRIFIYYVLTFCFLASCKSGPEEHQESEYLIELQVSRSGVNYSYPSDEKPIPGIDDEIYKFSLDTLAVMRSVFGYGKYSPIDLKIKIESSHRTKNTVSEKKMKSIYVLAEKLLEKPKPIVDSRVLDDWFIKLKIDDEVFIYYLGETSLKDGHEYKDIVTEIVNASNLKVEDWKWY